MKYLMLFILMNYITFAQKPTNEMFKSVIVCGGIQRSSTKLEDLENLFKANGNTISYELFDNNEIILTTKKYDNLTKKTTTIKLQFKFHKNDVSTLLELIGGMGNEVSFTSRELCTFYSQIEANIESKAILMENELKAVEEKKREGELKMIAGDYKGFFLEDGDEMDDKITIDFKYGEFEDPYSTTSYKLIFDGDEYMCVFKYSNGEMEFKNRSWETDFVFDFIGKYENGIIHGTATIEKTTKYPFIGNKKSVKKGKYEVKKVN